MAVATSTYRNQYSGNGSQTVFPYTFSIADQDLLSVFLVSETTGLVTTQTITTHYTVDSVGDDSGGNVTFVTAPTSLQQVIIKINYALLQETEYTPNDPFPANTHEAALDYLLNVCKSLQAQVDQCVKLQDNGVVTSTEIEDIELLPYGIPRITSSGTALEAVDFGTLARIQDLDNVPAVDISNDKLVIYDHSTGLIRKVSPVELQGAGATTIVGVASTKAEFDAACSDGDFLYVGDVTSYTNEQAQDAVGGILTDSSTVDFTYNDGANTITAEVIANTSTQKVEVVKNSGAVVGTRKQLNFIEGTNVTLTIADDVGNDQVDITIAASGGGGGGLSDGDYGDITVSGSSTALTIDNDVVTYAKMQNISATDKLLGRSTAGAGDTEEIACTAAGRAILDDVDASAQRTTLGLGTLATQSGTFSGTSSGTNTGDQTSIVGITGTKAEFDTAVTDGNILYVGDITQYTDELAQDAVGGILTDSSTIDFTYNDGANTITAAVIANTSTQKVEVVKNSGATVGTRKQLNFIEGTNVTLTIADDAGNDQVDITIEAASGAASFDYGMDYIMSAGGKFTL